MNINTIEKDQDLITKFLNNELTNEEVLLFKARYGSDTEFTSEVNAHSEIYLAFKAAAEIEQEKKVEKPGELKGPSVIPAKHYPYFLPENKWVMRIAAVVVPLIAFTVGLSLRQKPALPGDELYARFYENSQPKEESRSFAPDQQASFQFLQKDIDAAIMESMNALSSGADIHAFGLYCMDQQRFNEAVIAFKSLSRWNDQALLESSEWHLALCYLKLHDTQNAKMELSAIGNKPSHKFYQESKKILKKLIRT